MSKADHSEHPLASQAKTEAKRLHSILKKHFPNIKLLECLESYAQMKGFQNWNLYLASLAKLSTTDTAQEPEKLASLSQAEIEDAIRKTGDFHLPIKDVDDPTVMSIVDVLLGYKESPIADYAVSRERYLLFGIIKLMQELDESDNSLASVYKATESTSKMLELMDSLPDQQSISYLDHFTVMDNATRVNTLIGIRMKLQQLLVPHTDETGDVPRLVLPKLEHFKNVMLDLVHESGEPFFINEKKKTPRERYVQAKLCLTHYAFFEPLNSEDFSEIVDVAIKYLRV